MSDYLRSVITRTNRVVKPKKERSQNARYQLKWGLFFLMPWFIGLLAFRLLPIIFTFFLSFTDYNDTKEFSFDTINWIGLDNYAKLFNDPDLADALGVTFRFVLVAVPASLILGLSMALLVNSKYLLIPSFFRTIFFLPNIIPTVAGLLIFQGVLNPQSGWLNMALKIFGIDGPRWLYDPDTAVFALNLVELWGIGNFMMVYLIALQKVPSEIYEAVRLDGANSVQSFYFITIPMISPALFYSAIITVIASFQYFVIAMLLGGRNGDPQGATLFFNLHFYREAFVFNNMGYASTLSILLFAIIMGLTALMFGFLQRGVYYTSPDA
jgi:multiple sugar transport system permease protein